MPKLKTHKGAAKRFSLSSSGKIMRSKGMKSHLRRKKSKRNKRLFGSKILLDEAVGKRIIKLLRRYNGKSKRRLYNTQKAQESS